MADVPMSGMTPDATVEGTEKILVLDGTTSKTLTTDKMSDYVISNLTGATVATPTTGDILWGDRSDTERTFTLDAVSSYAVGYGWTAASEANPTVSGDMLLVDRSGTKYTMDVDTLSTYVQSYIEAAASLDPDILDIAGLAAATLGATDEFIVDQGGTAKSVALSALETKLWADFVTHVTGLTAVVTAADADVFHVIQSGTEKYVTGTTLAAYFLAEIGGDIVDNVWDDATTTTSTQDGDVYVFERAGARYAMNAEYLADYAIAEFGAESAVVAGADGDKLAMWRSGTAGTLTVDLLATYVQDTILDDFATETSALGTDTVLFNRAGAGSQITAANLATYMQTAIEAAGIDPDSLDIAGLAAATLNTTDEFIVDQSGTAKSATLASLETKLWTDYATYVAALTDIATVADDDVFYVLDAGSTAKYATGLEIATYVIAEAWTASAAASVDSGDTMLIHNGTSMEEATVDQLQTFVLTGAQSTILDLSGLSDAAGIAGTDHLLLSQAGTPAKYDLADAAEYVLDTLDTYTAALSAATGVDGTDYLYLLDGGTTSKKVTAANLAAYCVSAQSEYPWVEVSSSKYTATPASTSQITMSDTSDFAVGYPVRYTYGGTTYYGVVSALAANSSITLAGATLNVGSDLTALYVGVPNQVVQLDFFVSGAYAGSVQDILAAVNGQYARWKHSAAYLVSIHATHSSADTGAAQPKVNVKVEGSLVSTEDTNAGLQLSTAGTWVDGSAVAIDTTNYAVARDDDLEVRVTSTGTNADAEDLSISLVFVLA